jgi:hypothetical protein
MMLRGGILIAVLALAAPSAALASAPPVGVVVYRSGDCGSWREAVATVKAAARELNVRAKIRVVKVRDVEHARGLNFHGSPSVLVEGVDVEGPEVAERPASFG